MFRKSPSRKILTAGLGVGLLGATLFAARYAFRRGERRPLPEQISPRNFQSRVLLTGGGEMLFHHAGEGEPLLFVHSVGVGASSYEWSRVYHRFAERFHVLAPDLIGFGESHRPKKPLMPEEHAESLADLIRSFGSGKPAIVVAAGIGCGFAALLAARHPELVKRVILLVPGGEDFPRGPRLPLGLRLSARIPTLGRFYYRNYLANKTAIQRWLETSGFFDRLKVSVQDVEIYHSCAMQYAAEHALLAWMGGKMPLDFEATLRRLVMPLDLVWLEREGMRPGASTPAGGSVQTHLLRQAGLLVALEDAETVTQLLQELINGSIRVVSAE